MKLPIVVCILAILMINLFEAESTPLTKDLVKGEIITNPHNEQAVEHTRKEAILRSKREDLSAAHFIGNNLRNTLQRRRRQLIGSSGSNSVLSVLLNAALSSIMTMCMNAVTEGLTQMMSWLMSNSPDMNTIMDQIMPFISNGLSI